MKGRAVAAASGPASLCIVLVQSPIEVAPAASNWRAAVVSVASTWLQRFSAMAAASGAKSSDTSTSDADASPPTRSRTPSFSSR